MTYRGNNENSTSSNTVNDSIVKHSTTHLTSNHRLSPAGRPAATSADPMAAVRSFLSPHSPLPPSPRRSHPPTPLHLPWLPTFSSKTTPTSAVAAGISGEGVSGDGGGVVVMAAGGTGGHVYPAIAIAEELRATEPSARILFLGPDSGMVRAAASTAGFGFSSVPAAALARPLLSPRNLLLPLRLLRALLAALCRIRELRPDVVVGTGGYAAFPVCLAAAFAGVKLVVQEQNAAPGVANSILGRFADLVFVGFEACSAFFPNRRCVVSGNPIRASLRRYVSKSSARAHFFPATAAGGGSSAARPQVVLVLGGSLGSNAMNVAILNMYYKMLKQHKNRFVLWQTGVDGFVEMESLVKRHPRLFLTPFLDSMDLAYAAADLVISRAGAMTCSEILANGKPSILIPSPNVAEDHQSKNAHVMENISAAKVLAEDELDSSTLEVAIDEILGDESVMAEMSEMAMKAARPDASSLIAQGVLSLLQTRTKS